MSEEARQQAYEEANLKHPLPVSGITDPLADELAPPLELLKRALGRAYSDRVEGRSHTDLLGRIRQVLDRPGVAALAPGYRQHLATVVQARSMGNRCGCILTQTALQDLSAALEGRANV